MPTTTFSYERARLCASAYGCHDNLLDLGDLDQDPRFTSEPNSALWVHPEGGEPHPLGGWFYDPDNGAPTHRPTSGGDYGWFIERGHVDALLGSGCLITPYSTEVIAYFDLGDGFVGEQTFADRSDGPVLTRLWRTIAHFDVEPMAIIMAWMYGGVHGQAGKFDDPNAPIGRDSLDRILNDAASHMATTRTERRELADQYRNEFLGTDCTVLDALRFFPDDDDLDLVRLESFSPIFIDS